MGPRFVELVECLPVGRATDVLADVGQRLPCLAGPDPDFVGSRVERFVACNVHGTFGVIEHDHTRQVDGRREANGQVDLGAVPVLGEEPAQGKLSGMR